MTLDDRLTILATLWSAWARHGQAMTPEQWQRPTRLGDWDVRSLYTHAATWPRRFPTLLERVTDTPPTHDTAAALLREFNRPGGVAHTRREQIAAAAREDAAAHPVEQAVDQFRHTGPRAIETARRLGPVAVDYGGHAILPLAEAVSIGVMEATVHLLDLQRALGVPPDVPADGLRHTVAVLVDMAPSVDLIEVATGRGTAKVFPVLT